jgi:hypothetical protein
MTREAFEALISAPPFEMPIERFDDRCAWPGGYTELEVDLAWQAWQAATNTALERAADVCETILDELSFANAYECSNECAAAIRALKDADKC